MRSVALLGLLLASVGCSSESGLVVAVPGPAVSELELQIGVAAPEGSAPPGDPQGTPGHSLFILDQSASGTRIEVSGRDLRANPYELLLHDGAAAPSTVRIEVLAGPWPGILSAPPAQKAAGSMATPRATKNNTAICQGWCASSPWVCWC